jgi:YVTN family beta-propeller protein
MKTLSQRLVFAVLLCCTSVEDNSAAAAYHVFVSNERSGNLTVIDSDGFQVTASIPVGKRPRGMRASPDGKLVYVALSGTPISPPPRLDANGNPIFDRNEDDAKDADKSADGIGVVDVAQKKLLRKISVGSDPEQLGLSRDGKKLFASNEDIGTASVLDIASGKVEHIIPVSREPEGVAVSPDGKFFYVTCETEGEIYAIDTKNHKVISHFNVGGRPRSADFLPDSSHAFVPSESSGQMHWIDCVNHKVLKSIALPKGSRPMCVRVAPDGKRLYVSTGRSGSVCVLAADTGEVLSNVKVGTRPWGIDISPDGKTLFAANGPSDDVSVVDLAAEKEIMRIKSPGSPWGVVVVPASK